MLISAYGDIQGWGLFVDTEQQSLHIDHLSELNNISRLGDIIAHKIAKNLHERREILTIQKT